MDLTEIKEKEQDYTRGKKFARFCSGRKQINVKSTKLSNEPGLIPSHKG